MIKSGLVVGLLEDDPDMAALVGQWLDEAGYTVRLFRNANEYRRRQGSEAIDLLLLDWMLPDTSGIEVLEVIRASANNRLPVIFLTARDAEDDLVRGLSSGADDYVVKPPKRRELLARVQALLRRHGSESDAGETIELAPYSVDPQRRRVSIEGREIELTQREFDLASFLFRRHGRIISRDALLENVWNLSAAVSTRTVDTHVSRLRKKLELNGEQGWRLAAIYQHGYRLERV
ncbi:MAG: response regulator transcription factor [Dokdonella sp.]